MNGRKVLGEQKTSERENANTETPSKTKEVGVLSQTVSFLNLKNESGNKIFACFCSPFYLFFFYYLWCNLCNLCLNVGKYFLPGLYLTYGGSRQVHGHYGGPPAFVTPAGL